MQTARPVAPALLLALVVTPCCTPGPMAHGDAPDALSPGPAADAGAAPGARDMTTAVDLPRSSSVDLVAGAPQPAAGHHRCGWMYTVDASANADFSNNISFFQAIHPVWWALQPDGVHVRAIAGSDDRGVTDAARTRHVALMPTVASVDDVGFTRTMLYSPANRAAHVKLLVDLAVSKGYSGIDLDYEHLWNDADAAPLSAFLHDLGTALHAAGKTLSIAVPGVTGKNAVWNYADLATAVDVIHIMGYDYHGVGANHPGPTAPLGWIQEIEANAVASGRPEKFLLALPNYGATTASTCALTDCAARCTSAVTVGSDHMLTCSYGTFPPDRILHCDTASEGTLFFDDVQSLEEKVTSAKDRGLGGVSYWQVGSEPAGFFAMIRNYY